MYQRTYTCAWWFGGECFMWILFLVFICKKGKNEDCKRSGLWIFNVFVNWSASRWWRTCMLKLLFSCLTSYYFARLKPLSYWQGRMAVCLSVFYFIPNHISLVSLSYQQCPSLPGMIWVQVLSKHSVFKQPAFIQKVRWATSLCAYATVKRPLVENVDAASFARVPKLLDDTDYTQYCTRVVFVGSRPHWPVVLVEKNAEDMESESHVRCRSPEFWSCLPELLVPHLERI